MSKGIVATVGMVLLTAAAVRAGESFAVVKVTGFDGKDMYEVMSADNYKALEREALLSEARKLFEDKLAGLKTAGKKTAPVEKK